jgi:Family of unknown function (DUF6361)
MASTIAWLDYDDAQRQRMREIVALFREQGTIDELGLGRVRNVFSERLFPGTSVLWRRARYLLFVPWTYELIAEGEGSRVSADEAGRRMLRRLRDGLFAAGEFDGLIGRDRPNVQQTPDIIVWSALAEWGIRESIGTLRQFQRSLDAHARRRRGIEDELPPELPWHARLPRPPGDFPDHATFALRQSEAEFLRDLVLAEDARPESAAARRSDSMMAVLIRRPLVSAEAPWLHPLDGASDRLRAAVHHAGCFSDVTHGAAVLYAALLADKRGQKARLDEAEEVLANWAHRLSGSRLGVLRKWRREIAEFWALVRSENPRIDRPTRDFVENWADLALDDPAGVSTNRQARGLVAAREAFWKGGRARLGGDTRRTDEGGAVPSPLLYRWPNAHRIAADIRAGLEA